MTKPQLLFDSNVIYWLIREMPDTAVDRLIEGYTINLAYYELGNALWRECLLLKKISLEEAQKSLGLMYAILEKMQITPIDSDTGAEVLEVAYKFSLTFYDSAYLTEAKENGKTLITDDNKLAKAAEKIGVKTLSSQVLLKQFSS